MKILKKALISLSIILFNTKAYATTTGTYVPESGSGIGKFFLLLVAIGLVALVLFIGYKMDKNEAQEKRKEKIKKQRDDVYAKMYTSYDDKEIQDAEENEEVEELPEINFAPKTEEYFKNSSNDSTQKIDIVNENEIDTYTSLKPDVEKVEEKVVYEEVEEDGYTEEEDVYESEDFGETQVISFDEENDENETFDSTMVFDTPVNNLDLNMNVEEKIINKISDIKGYDYEDEDMDLLDLEQTIAEANIKKYTRDKNQEMIKVKRVPKKKEPKKEEKKEKKESKSEKKYTRKKSEKKETKKEESKTKKETTVKKYKAKKDTSKTKKEETKKVEEIKPKTKKYTKAKEKETAAEEIVEKPKRGRKPTTKK